MFARDLLVSEKAHLGCLRLKRAVVRLVSRATLALLGCLFFFGPDHAGAQASGWPERPIKLVVGYPAGGGADILARLLSDKLAKILGQPVIIDNRAGAGGTIAAAAVARAEPDGYTFLAATSSEITVAPATVKSPGFNSETDFQPVGLVARWPHILVVSSASPFNSVSDLVTYAKANPGKMSFSSMGSNTSGHLTGEMLKAQTGIDVLHVPYRGSSPSLTDLMGGQVQFTFDSPLATFSLIQSGKLKPLAVTGDQRLPGLPDVPTLDQSKINGVIGGAWVGILGPAKTPGPIVDKLNKAINEALAEPELKAAMETRRMQPLGGTPDDLRRQITGDIVAWRDAAKRSGAVAE